MVSIGVVGAGVGGLTVALALHEAGFRDIDVYERGEPGRASPNAPESLIVPPNATRVLHALGLKDALHDICGHPQIQLQKSWRSGYLLTQRPLGHFAEERYGAPHSIVGRDDLLRVLLGACRAHDITVSGNAACVGISQTDHRVDVDLGGADAAHDVVIGCDGTSSTVRRDLHYPQEGTRSDATLWWGSASIDALPRPLMTQAITSWLGPGQYLRAWRSADGAHLEYMAIINGGGATLRSPAQDLGAHFESWHPHVRALVESSTPSGPEPVTEHEPIGQWYDRRVALLGDACHALTPHLQQGAALAIEDAWVLSRMLERWEDEPGEGFSEYQRYRKVRVTRVRQASRTLAGEWTVDGRGQALMRNVKLSLGSRFLPELAMQQLDWLYGYDCIKGFE